MLKLKKLELTDFMCVNSAKFDFTDDKVVLITGPNGSGKSTVLEAIALCLVENKRADTYKDYVMNGKETAHISLEAEIYDNPITFDITLRTKNPPMDRTVLYKERTYKNSEVTELLESFDIKYFSDIIMSMQGSDDITKLTPAQRETFLQKLLSFDFSSQVEECKEAISEIKEKITYNTNLIDFNKKAITERKSEIKDTKELTFNDSDITNINAEIKELNEKLSKVNEAIEKRNEKVSEKNKLLSDKSTWETAINANSVKETSLDGVPLRNNTLVEKYNSDIESCNNELKSLEDLTSQYDAAKKELENAESSLTWDTTDYDEVISKLSTERDVIVKDVADKQSAVKQAQNHLSLIDKGVCPECGHTFDSKDKDLYEKAFEDASKLLEESNKLLSEKDSDIQKAKESKQKALEEKSEVDSKLKVLRDDVTSKKLKVESIDVNSINSKIDNINKEILKLNEETSKIEEDKAKLKEERKVLESNLSSVISDIENKDKEISELDVICNDYRSINGQLSQKQEVLSEYNNQIMQNTMILQNNEKIKEAVKKLEEDTESAVKNITKLENEKKVKSDALQIFDKTFPQFLILKTCNVLEREMNLFIQSIFPDMEIRLFQNKKGVEFFYTNNRFETTDFSKEKLINVKMASGFEKALLSIAFKVSLCRAYGLRFAFFDEIDQSSTDENSENLFRTITSTGLFDQVFIITHKPTVRDAIKGVAPNLKSYYVHGKGEFSLEEDY